VTHRDLKPENILFDSDFRLKVSDFGLSRDAKGDQGNYNLKSRVGTEGYKPPEMEQGNYTGIQADIFAAGVIIFIMFNGTPPFLSTKPHDRIYKLIKDKNFQKFWQLHEKNKKPGFYPDSFKRLINCFFSAEPDRRPSFETLDNDEWMRGDDLMGNELGEYMRIKAEKLFQKDENKQKMAQIKKELFLKKGTHCVI
jgi:serine/threonine protein kinase